MTNNTKPEGKDIESQLIDEISKSGSSELQRLFLKWQDERTARLEKFNHRLQSIIEKSQLSPSPHKASQEIEEKNEWELFCMMCEGIIFPLAGNLTVSQLYEQFKAQGYKITKL